MKKLRNLINFFKHEHKETNSKKMVLVSDYAAALGAKYKKPSRAERENRSCLYIQEEALAPKYQYRLGRTSVVDYPQVEGFIPDITTLIYFGFAVHDGVITYHGKPVLFPQRRVEKPLEEYLTALMQESVSPINKNEFSLIENHLMHHYGDDVENKVKESTYCFQDNLYRLRIDKNNKKDLYQWYRILPVAAHYVNEKDENTGSDKVSIQCESVLLADHSYGERKFVDDIRDSTYLDFEAEKTQKSDNKTKSATVSGKEI